jgi:hypothetical protein
MEILTQQPTFTQEDNHTCKISLGRYEVIMNLECSDGKCENTNANTVPGSQPASETQDTPSIPDMKDLPKMVEDVILAGVQNTNSEQANSPVFEKKVSLMKGLVEYGIDLRVEPSPRFNTKFMPSFYHVRLELP